eukprot:s273_g16.t1
MSVTPAATFTTTPDVITPTHALHADEPEVADVMSASSTSQARLPASEPHVPEVSSSCITQVTSTHAPEAESSSSMPAVATSPSDSVAPWLRDRTEKLCKLRDTLFGWPQELLQKLADLSSDDEHEYAEYMLTMFNSMSMSTSFSEVDSPSTALAMMGAAALMLQGREVTKDSVPRTRNKFGIEWLSQSQQELSRHPYGSSCIFSDINDFWHPILADKLDTISRERLVMAVLKDLVKSSVCTGRVAYCKKCNRDCRVSEADLHIGGMPCVDFSARGQQGQLDGPTTTALLVFIAMRRDLQEPFFIQENVASFLDEFFWSMLSDLYELQSCVIDPESTFGWPVARRAKFVVGRHKTKKQCRGICDWTSSSA